MSTTISSVAAGGILLSAPDFATWKNALAGDALLSDSIRGLTMTQSRFGNGLPCDYTMGWFIDRLPDGRTIRHHRGSVLGLQCQHIENRSEERRVGKEGDKSCTSGWLTQN